MEDLENTSRAPEADHSPQTEGHEPCPAGPQEETGLRQYMDMLSHDIRSPLSTVSTFLGIILSRQGDALDDKSKEYMGHCIALIRDMGQLLTDTLHYMKLDSRLRPAGQVPVSAPMDSNRALERALLILKDRIEKTGAEISAHELPQIRADETMLVQVFQNLLANSLKFTEAGTKGKKKKPRVRITAALRAPGGQGHAEWLFSFSDNGPGINPEDRERIFEPFARAGHGADKEAGKGAGLGLAICKKLVELHGGRIWVDKKSAPGQGATFHFTIPE